MVVLAVRPDLHILIDRVGRIDRRKAWRRKLLFEKHFFSRIASGRPAQPVFPRKRAVLNSPGG
jgi:hypothetical protein